MAVKYPKPIKAHPLWDGWFNAQPEGDPLVEYMIDLLKYNPFEDPGEPDGATHP